MAKKRLFPVTMVVAVLLIAVALPATARGRQDAAGHWQYIAEVVDVQVDGCKTTLTITEEGIWTGTFAGNSHERGKVIEHCSGMTTFTGIVRFDEATVNGKTDGLTMFVAGRYPDVESGWYSHWFIVNGTHQLKRLHGHGVWFGPGAGGPGVVGHIDYTGSIRMGRR